jgi:hypothetical protein
MSEEHEALVLALLDQATSSPKRRTRSARPVVQQEKCEWLQELAQLSENLIHAMVGEFIF